MLPSNRARARKRETLKLALSMDGALQVSQPHVQHGAAVLFANHLESIPHCIV